MYHVYAILCEIYNYALFVYANFYYILHNYQSLQVLSVRTDLNDRLHIFRKNIV